MNNSFENEDTDTDIADIGMLILQARYGPEARRIEKILDERAMRQACRKNTQNSPTTSPELQSGCNHCQKHPQCVAKVTMDGSHG